MLEAALAEGRALRPDAVVAMGGGAALDLGKALAALIPSDAPPLVHLEVVGEGLPLGQPPLPCVAIPTTAGTGSEATKNAVIGVPEAARKVSLRDDRMVPALAVIDPALTDGTPMAQTLASGLDAVTQVIEPYLSSRATPFTDALARPAIGIGLQALVTLADAGEDAGARDRIAYVAHVSGIALANAGLGAVHGLAGVLGGEIGAAHGALCARLLPHALLALDREAPATGETRDRLTDISTIISGVFPGGLSELRIWIGDRVPVSVPPLDDEKRAHIASAAQGASSMKASPVQFGVDSLAKMIADAF